MQYKISIIIPVYNCENYLEETLESLKNQTIGFNNIEVIIIDDNSTDSSKNIVKKFATQHYNVIPIFLLENSGAAGLPRNIGIELATGKYIMFVDSDDILNVDACEILFNLANSNKSEIYIGKYITFKSEESWESNIYINELNREFINKEIKEVPELLNASFNLMNKIFLRKFIIDNNLRFAIGVISQDALFTTEAYMISKKISFIPVEIYKYRIREDKDNLSVTQIRNIKYFEDFIFIRNSIMDIYEKYKILDYFKVRYFKDLKWLLHQIKLAYKFMDKTTCTLDNEINLIKVIYPFVCMILNEHLQNLSDTDKDIVDLIIHKEFRECISLLKKL